MKSLLLMFFFLVSGMIFSQKKEVVKMTRTQLNKVNLLSELVKIQAKNPKAISYEVLAKVRGKLVSTEARGDSLSSNVKAIFNGADVGSKIYFDTLIDPKKPGDRTFVTFFEIIVTE
jgi:hypothetical protein